MSIPRACIPKKGKYRVLRVELYASDGEFVGDYRKQTKAFKVADEGNRRTGMANTYYLVFNKKGECVRGKSALRR